MKLRRDKMDMHNRKNINCNMYINITTDFRFKRVKFCRRHQEELIRHSIFVPKTDRHVIRFKLNTF